MVPSALSISLADRLPSGSRNSYARVVTMPVAPISKLTWVVAGVFEAMALVMGFGLWIFGVMSAPGRFLPGTSGDLKMVLSFEVLTAVVCLLVPGWLARRAQHAAWWLAGVIPAVFALGTVLVLLSDWKRGR